MLELESNQAFLANSGDNAKKDDRD